MMHEYYVNLLQKLYDYEPRFYHITEFTEYELKLLVELKKCSLVQLVRDHIRLTSAGGVALANAQPVPAEPEAPGTVFFVIEPEAA